MEKTDVQHSHAVVAHMRNAEDAEILRRRYSPRQVLDLMGRFDFAVGMRLHFLIFAVLRGTPFAALPYASKVRGLLQDLDMPAPPLESVGIGQLIATIDQAWDSRDSIRSTIRASRPAMQSRARETNTYLLNFLRERLPDRMTAALALHERPNAGAPDARVSEGESSRVEKLLTSPASVTDRKRF